jgi:hypothetical protein
MDWHHGQATAAVSPLVMLERSGAMDLAEASVAACMVVAAAERAGAKFSVFSWMSGGASV